MNKKRRQSCNIRMAFFLFFLHKRHLKLFKNSSLSNWTNSLFFYNFRRSQLILIIYGNHIGP
jgi:alanyl-tRNA synthetase